MKRFSYLLGQTELFQHFVDIKVCFLTSVHFRLIQMLVDVCRRKTVIRLLPKCLMRSRQKIVGRVKKQRE